MSKSNSYRGGRRRGRKGGGSSRPHSRRRSGGGGRKKKGGAIHESRFINRAVEKAEHEKFVPKHSFSDFAISDVLKENLTKKGFTTPTPIQDQIIPHILKGNDVVGIANTGTGKTLAFVVPLLNKILAKKDERILVVTPTRELAQQIEAEFSKLASKTSIYSVVVVGGVSMHKQIKALRRPFNVVIATPGRLMDMRKRKMLDLRTFSTIVLDEADRMLDMGFIGDIETVMKDVGSKRQALFFSATMPQNVERFIDRFLSNPVRVSVKKNETAEHIDQDVVRVSRGDSKITKLSDLLGTEACEKALVFGRTKRGVDRLSRDLSKRGFKTDAIHGDKSQSRRQKALKRFKENHINILVATDVAARGLDIPNVSHVINYDAPDAYEDYVHRIGRTGRAGNTGKALTFVQG